MLDMLISSLASINSLRNYYKKELKTITRRTKKGLKENRFGYLMDYYFSVLTSNNEEAMKKDSFKSLERYANKHIEIRKPIEEGRVIFQYKDEEKMKGLNINLNIKEASLLFRQYWDMIIIHSNNTLIMLMIRFEEFISNVIRVLFDMFPNKYLDDKTISYSDIIGRDPDMIRMAILDREIDLIMRESFTRWFELLKSHKIDLSVCNVQFNNLKEIYARRNIIVHNSGIVNDTYIKNSGRTGIKTGELLRVDDEYLDEAFNCIKTLMFIITIQSSKLFKDIEQTYLEEVFNAAFSELSSKNYCTSKTVFEVLMSHKSLSDEYKNMAKVNYWIATKEMGTDIQNELQSFDVSALENRFKIAKYILLKDYKQATNLLEEEIKHQNVCLEMFDWPLYMHYVHSDEFEGIKRKHGELFDSNVLDFKDSKPEDVKVIDSSIKKDVEESKKEEKKNK